MKTLIDILLFIILILEFSRGYMAPIFHEIFGIILIILLILHLILNKNYFKTIFKGKYNYKRIIILTINLGFLISISLALIFGILSSEELFDINSNITIIKLHKITAYLSLIILGLHLGININTLTNKLNKIKNKIIIYIIEIIIIIYGIYVFIKLDIPNHLTGKYGFSMITENLFTNIFDYLMIILMVTIITHYVYKK